MNKKLALLISEIKFSQFTTYSHGLEDYTENLVLDFSTSLRRNRKKNFENYFIYAY